MLINSETGADHAKLICNIKTSNGLYRYFFKNYSKIDKLIQGSKRLGLAFPLQSDKFKVVRFDMKGSKLALTALRLAVGKKGGARTTGTRDKIL